MASITKVSGSLDLIRNTIILNHVRTAMEDSGANKLISEATSQGDGLEEMSAAEDTALEIALEPYNLRILGSGFFSLVLEHLDYPELAIKVGCKAEDSGAAYAAWVRDQIRRGEDCTHLPDIQLITRDAPNRYYVIMKKYHPNAGKYHGFVLGRAYQYCTAGALSRLVNESTWPGELPETLIKPLRRMARFFEGVAMFDLHSNNVMLDDDGTLIITDPVSFKEG